MFVKYWKNNVKKRCHIYRAVKPRGRHLSFHTPGHKRRGLDVTELGYTDNLCSPNGCILAAQEDIARILGAEKSFILTDGSTSGILSMLRAFYTWGGRSLAIPETAHKSVKNGCKLMGICAKEYTETDLSAKLEGIVSGADGMMLTSPTYYGKVPPLQAIKTACQKQNKPLLIDGAHGGHLYGNPTLYAGTYADMWVDGVHKCLPAFTQGAVVSAKTEQWAKWLQDAVDIFRTSSPSYPIMISVEYAVKYPRNEKLESLVRKTAQENAFITVHDDWTKVLVKAGANAFAMQRYLESKGLYAEFCDGEYIMFYLSPATPIWQFNALIRMLKKAVKRYPYTAIVKDENSHVLLDVSGEIEEIALTDAENRICAKECGLFPPCTPLLKVGERIGKEKIQLLQQANGTFGLVDGKITVWKGDVEE